jgi:hypothetical protein
MRRDASAFFEIRIGASRRTLPRKTERWIRENPPFEQLSIFCFYFALGEKMVGIAHPTKFSQNKILKQTVISTERSHNCGT